MDTSAMATLTNLSANSLKYYISSRRLKSAFCFFNIEIRFLKKLVRSQLLLAAEKASKDTLKQIGGALSITIGETKTINRLLDSQLKKLELLSQKRLSENSEELAAKQAYLECLVMDWIKKYHELKTHLFFYVEPLLAGPVTKQ